MLASGRPGDRDALRIHPDAALPGATLPRGQSAVHALGPARRAYLVAATGRVTVNGIAAKARDGVAVAGEEMLTIVAEEDAEIVLADLP